MFSKILTTASYVPETRRTNADLEKMVHTTDAWIMERVGIKERRISQPFETHFYMALHAVKKAAEKSGIEFGKTSIILTGNTHVPGLIPCHASLLAADYKGIAAWDIIAPDDKAASYDAVQLFPNKNYAFHCHKRESLAQVIAKELGMNADDSYDLVTGCASFNFGLALADARIKCTAQNVIVAAVDKLRDIVNEKDRATVVLFGELAGAAVLAPSKQEGFISHYLETEGKYRDVITVKKEPGCDKPYFWQDGKAVYKWAVPKMIELAKKAVDDTRDVCGNRLFIVPHQANPRMIEAAKKNAVFKDVYATIITGDMFGNSSTASIAHALDVLITEGIEIKGRKTKPEKGDYIGIIGFGAGLSSGVNVYRVI
jgi:3-oxoacyl-[acyl-carrier-protein] synthase-3